MKNPGGEDTSNIFGILAHLLLWRHGVLSRKGIQKAMFANLTQKKIQEWSKLSFDEILKLFYPAPHGPLSYKLDEILETLQTDGIIITEQYTFSNELEGIAYKLTDLGKNLVRELMTQNEFQNIRNSMLPPMAIIHYEKLAKHRFLSHLLQLNLHFQSIWTLNFAWSIFFQLHYQNDFLTREECIELITLLNKIEAGFRFPRFAWSEGKWSSDPDIDFINELLDLMKHILDIDSPTGNELEVATFFKELAKKEGLISEIDEAQNVMILLPSKRAQAYSDVESAAFADAKLAFIFHTDTVPRKIEVRTEGGKLFGRGSVDNKVFGLIAVYAMILLKRNGFFPDFTIEIFGEASEESDDKEKKGLANALKKGWGKNVIQSLMREASGGKVMVGQRKRNIIVLEVYGESHHSAHVNNAEMETKIMNKEDLSNIEKIDLRIPIDHIINEIRLIPKTLGLLPGKFGVTTITAEAQYHPPNRPIGMTPNECAIIVEVRLSDEKHWELILNEIRNILKTWCERANLYYEIKEGANPDYLVGDAGYGTLQFLREFTTFFELFQAEPTKRNSYEFSTSGQLLSSYGISVCGYATAPERRAHKKAHEKLRQKIEIATEEEYITFYEVVKDLIFCLALMMLAIRDRDKILLARRPKNQNNHIKSYVI